LAGIPGHAPERKNPDAGRRITLTRFFPPFYQLLERSGNPGPSGEKEVPVRHEDKTSKQAVAISYKLLKSGIQHPENRQQIPILRLPDRMTRQWQAPPHKLDVTAS